MEEIQSSNRKRVFSPEPNGMLRAGAFSLNYVNYLLPALRNIKNIGCEYDKEDKCTEKMVRLQVDMALAVSAGGFLWSHALKQKLEKGMQVNFQSESTKSQPDFLDILFCKHEKGLVTMIPPVPRTISFPGSKPNSVAAMNSGSQSTNTDYPKRKRKRICSHKENKEVVSRLATLRKVLPGGEHMQIHDLLEEVESYIVCLELQVNILQTLVSTRRIISLG